MGQLSISVVTVVLDGLPHIRDAVESVLHQTTPCKDYVIVDGGSTDGTREYLTSTLLDNPLVKLVFEPDAGLYDAMNKGISRSTGAVIGILNSDDRYKRDALERVNAIFSTTGCRLVGSNLNVIGPAGEYRGTRPCYANFERANYLQRMTILHPTVFVSRTVYDTIGAFNCRYRLCADHEFLIRCIRAGVVIETTTPPLAEFRLGGKSGGLNTFWETRNIAVAYGRSTAAANWYFMLSVLKAYIARLLPTRAVTEIEAYMAARRA